MAFPIVPASSSNGPPQSFGYEQSRFQHQTSSLLPQRRQPSNHDWEMLKDEIRQVYLVEKKTLKELAKQLCYKHGFRPTEKQLTKRLEQWDFWKNRRRKQKQFTRKGVIEAEYGRRFESTATRTVNRKTPGHHEGNNQTHVESRVILRQNSVLDICRTQNPKEPSNQYAPIFITECTDASLPTNGCSSIMTELARQLSGLNVSFSADTLLLEKTSNGDRPKEYLTTEDTKKLSVFGCSSNQEGRDVFTDTISLGYPHHTGKRYNPLKFQGYDVDFPSSTTVPSLSGELYPFPRSPVSNTQKSNSTPEFDIIQNTISDYLDRFERLSRLNVPEKHPAMIEIMRKLGRSYWSLNQGCKCEAWYRRELSARRLSGKSVLSIESFNAQLNIIYGIVLQGRFQEARALHETVHRNIFSDEVASLNDSLISRSLEILGSILYQQRYFNHACLCRREVVQIRLNTLGPWHEATLIAMLLLGSGFTDIGRYEESEEFLTTILQLSKEAVANDAIYWATDNLAIAKKTRGEFEASATIYRNLLTDAEPVLGKAHPNLLQYMHNFANTLLRGGHLEEAEKMTRKTLYLTMKHWGADHVETLETMELLGNILHERGCYEEGAQCFEKTFRGYSLSLGIDHTRTIWVCIDLAKCYYSLGRFEDALQLAREFVKEVEAQVACRKEPCWGDGGISKIQEWIQWLKEDMEYYQEGLERRDITEVDEELLSSDGSSNEEVSSGLDEIFDEGEI